MGQAIANIPLPTLREQAEPTGTLRAWVRWAAVVSLVTLLAGLTVVGISYRRWAWDFTQTVRFRGDINRNFTFGELALEQGYLNVHENQVRDRPPRDKKLDYPPLRLLTFQTWAAWAHEHRPGEGWSASYDFHAPLMRYYTALQWMAAAAAFLIVWHWRRRSAHEDDPLTPVSWSTGIVRATLAFALFWFDPGVVIIGHGWPSPNVWTLPFYLWTVLFCLIDRWFVAGLVLAIGVMMQGQLLTVVAVFVLWPLFAGAVGRMLRWVSGFALGFMAVASPWMLSIRPDIYAPERLVNWMAITWIALALVMLALVGLRRNLRGRMHWAWFLAPAAVAATVLTLPAIATQEAWHASLMGSAVLGVLVVFWTLSWRVKRYLLAFVAAACLALCVPFWGASTAWWTEGFLYGAERFTYVSSDIATNLPTLLTYYFGWQQIDDHAVQIPAALLFGWPGAPVDLNARQFLGGIFAVLLVANTFFIARHWRRGRLNLLVALVVPWVLFFTIMPQMSPRYAVFAAGVGAICIGHSFGMTMLTWVFSILTVVQTGLCMMNVNRREIWMNPNWLFNREMREGFHEFLPMFAWAEVLTAAVFVYVAFSLVRRHRHGAREAQPVLPVADA